MQIYINKEGIRIYNVKTVYTLIEVKYLAAVKGKETIKSKIDYRIVEISESSPTTEVEATIILNYPPSEDVLKSLSDLKVVKIFSFMNIVKVKGKAKDVIKIAENHFVTYIMLDDIVVKNTEWI